MLEEYFSDKDISASALLERFRRRGNTKLYSGSYIEKYSTSKRWIERNIVEDEKANLQKEAEDIVKNFLLLKIDEQIRKIINGLKKATAKS